LIVLSRNLNLCLSLSSQSQSSPSHHFLCTEASIDLCGRLRSEDKTTLHSKLHARDGTLLLLLLIRNLHLLPCLPCFALPLAACCSAGGAAAAAGAPSQAEGGGVCDGRGAVALVRVQRGASADAQRVFPAHPATATRHPGISMSAFMWRVVSVKSGRLAHPQVVGSRAGLMQSALRMQRQWQRVAR
jgi:hypothetical protein